MDILEAIRQAKAELDLIPDPLAQWGINSRTPGLVVRMCEATRRRLEAIRPPIPGPDVFGERLRMFGLPVQVNEHCPEGALIFGVALANGGLDLVRLVFIKQDKAGPVPGGEG